MRKKICLISLFFTLIAGYVIGDTCDQVLNDFDNVTGLWNWPVGAQSDPAPVSHSASSFKVSWPAQENLEWDYGILPDPTAVNGAGNSQDLTNATHITFWLKADVDAATSMEFMLTADNRSAYNSYWISDPLPEFWKFYVVPVEDFGAWGTEPTHDWSEVHFGTISTWPPEPNNATIWVDEIKWVDMSGQCGWSDDDTDGDGFGDADEAAAGTSPIDPLSTPPTCDHILNDFDDVTDLWHWPLGTQAAPAPVGHSAASFEIPVPVDDWLNFVYGIFPDPTAVSGVGNSQDLTNATHITFWLKTDFDAGTVMNFTMTADNWSAYNNYQISNPPSEWTFFAIPVSDFQAWGASPTHDWSEVHMGQITTWPPSSNPQTVWIDEVKWVDMSGQCDWSNNDTDGDGVGDADEVAAGTSPINPVDNNTCVKTLNDFDDVSGLWHWPWISTQDDPAPVSGSSSSFAITWDPNDSLDFNFGILPNPTAQDGVGNSQNLTNATHITFWAKADLDPGVSILLQMIGDYWTGYRSYSFTPTSDWTFYAVPKEMFVQWEDAPLTDWAVVSICAIKSWPEVAPGTATFWIDELKWVNMSGECEWMDEDLDGDGIDDLMDNCKLVSNIMQQDTDSDGTGDMCECIDAEIIGTSAIDISDLALMVQSWLISSPELPGDIYTDGIVDGLDFAWFSMYWNWESCPQLP